MKKVSVIGAGSWGIALSTVLSDNGCDVCVWSIIEEEIEMLNKERQHKDKLPGVMLSEKTVFTTDLEAACKGAGRALRMAVDMDPRHRDEIPSTKGVL